MPPVIDCNGGNARGDSSGKPIPGSAARDEEKPMRKIVSGPEVAPFAMARESYHR